MNITAITNTFRHVLICSKLDRKVDQERGLGTSSKNCFIFKARPSEMNDLSKIQYKKTSEEYLTLGLLFLHVHIKCIEYINRYFTLFTI